MARPSETSRLPSAADITASAWNQTTLEMLAEFMRRHGARAPARLGDTLRGDTIQTTVGTVRLLREVTTRRAVVLDAAEHN